MRTNTRMPYRMTATQKLLVQSDPVHVLRTKLMEGLKQGRWAPGSRLPTERSLCADFGISRSALRRVLQELRDMGLIVQKIGSGTYVAEQAEASSEKFVAAAISPAEIMEARLLLEPMLVDLIVNNATAADFERLEECCRQGEAASTLEEFELWDSALHEQLALATHNGFLISVFHLMAEVRNSGEWGLLKKKSATPERRARYEHEHRQLVSALKNRDAETARRHVMDHLVNVRLNLLGPV